MRKLVLKLRASELLFLLAGASTLFAIPFFQAGGGLLPWFLAKTFYFLGLIFFVRDVYAQKKRLS